MERIVIPPYDKYQLSTFVTNGDTVYIGHFGGSKDIKGNILKTAEEQMECTLLYLEKALNEIGLGLDKVVKLNVYLKNIKDFDGMHRAWVKCFSEGEYPVRLVSTSDFVDEYCLVQVEGIACYNE